MTKIRVFIFLTTIIIVGVLGALIGLYARGYRFNPDKLKFNPNGIFVAKSVPDGAQIYLNGELKIATNTSIPLPPGTYDVSIRKEGFLDWDKRLVIEKEVVTEVTAHLFKSAPSLSAITFTGISNPVPSPDMSKIAYIVEPNLPNNVYEDDVSGLWIIETVNLPIGFSREPRRITDGKLAGSTFQWSPNGREMLLETEIGSYLVDASTFTPQRQLINISATKEEVLSEWKEESKTKMKSQLNKFPDELNSILSRKASSLVFSPDEDMILYTASGSATIAENLIKQLPGASTQKQQREIIKNHIYVYDIKEDRNFLVYDGPDSVTITGGKTTKNSVRLSWFATSRHLVLAETNKVTIMDYDATNKKEVYSGSYVTPHAFPTMSVDRLLLLTNLGANSTPPNLYSLSLK